MKNVFLLFLSVITSVSLFAQSSQYDLFIQNGLDYLNEGQTQQAMTAFQNAHALDSMRVESYYYTGIAIATICYQTGQSCEGAIEMLTTAINIDPDFRKGYYNRGVCFLRINLYDNAINDFTMAIKKNQNDGDSYCNRGLAKVKAGKKQEGCKDIQKGVSLGSAMGKNLQASFCQ